MTPSKILLYFCLSFSGGIFLNSLISIPQLLMLGVLIFGLILISVLFRYKKLVVLGFCLLFLILGIFRHQGVEIRSTQHEIRNFNEIITLTGIVSEEPDIRANSQKIIIKTEEKILVMTNRYPEYKYGDKLEITGKLKMPPEDIGGFNYQEYLKKDGIYSVMDFPKIELLGQGFGSPLMEVLLSFKNKFKETAASFIPPPQVGILEALVFGDESEISKEWKEKFNITGTRHIAAVSGMNITIIASLILSFALALGLWRQQAFYLSVVLLILYILMIGAPWSAVRAGIMAGLFMTASYFGRLSLAGRAVVLAAAFMLFLNPLILRLDVGFQLSFLAVLGLIYLQPIFSNWFRKIPNPKIFPLRTTLSATFSAQIFTLPILIYNFGYVSLVSPLTNILVVPFLAPVTILIFIFGLSATLFSPLGWLFSFPAWLALTYITKIIDIFSKFPLASLSLKNISWVWLIIFYLILGFLIRRFQKREKLKFLNY